MWSFKKKEKKIYMVEYKDAWGDYGNSIVKACDMADAWDRAQKQRCNESPYQAHICISIKEIKEGEIAQ